MNRLKPYFQLVRLPNLFTAAADSLAGWLIVNGSLERPARWLPLVFASIAIYAAGIVLNDVFDFEIDKLERPNRPLPSGRVSWRLAAWFGGVALALGPILAALSGSMASFLVGLALAGCVLAYDGGLKKTLLGPEAMGACRGLNLLLGMSQAPSMGGPSAWVIAGSLAVFVVGVTWISRSEVDTGKRGGIALGVWLENFALFGVLLSSLVSTRLFGIMSVQGNRIAPALGMFCWLAVTLVINRANFNALRTPVPDLVQRAVKTGVLSLVWLDVVAVTTVQGPTAGLIVASLWIPAFVLGKWLYST
jgi:4-hydroxybenzoate polyprenyltransferase